MRQNIFRVIGKIEKQLFASRRLEQNAYNKRLAEPSLGPKRKFCLVTLLK